MKHNHSKEELGNSDVKFLIVDCDNYYRLDFKNKETEYSGKDISQGVKFWLNRCKLIVDGNVLMADKAIVWYSKNKKRSNLPGHIFTFILQTV